VRAAPPTAARGSSAARPAPTCHSAPRRSSSNTVRAQHRPRGDEPRSLCADQYRAGRAYNGPPTSSYGSTKSCGENTPAPSSQSLHFHASAPKPVKPMMRKKSSRSRNGTLKTRSRAVIQESEEPPHSVQLVRTMRPNVGTMNHPLSRMGCLPSHRRQRQQRSRRPGRLRGVRPRVRGA